MQAQPIISTATGLPLESLPFMKPGVYRHYKGGMYRLIAVVRHTETEEAMVVYAPLGGGDAWVRPYKMFVESTEHQSRIVPRFEWVSAE